MFTVLLVLTALALIHIVMFRQAVKCRNMADNYRPYSKDDMINEINRSKKSFSGYRQRIYKPQPY